MRSGWRVKVGGPEHVEGPNSTRMKWRLARAAGDYNVTMMRRSYALALTAALAAYVMVKFYGVIFLGQPREAELVNAHDANWLERLGLGWLALGCILIGILPQFAIRAVFLLQATSMMEETCHRSRGAVYTARSAARFFEHRLCLYR